MSRTRANFLVFDTLCSMSSMARFILKMSVIGLLIALAGATMVIFVVNRSSQNANLSCSQLPSLVTIDATVAEHRDAVERIIREVGARYRTGAVTPLWMERSVIDGLTSGSYVGFQRGESEACVGTDRGIITITFPAQKDKTIIQDIIDADTFFGIPYRLVNI